MIAALVAVAVGISLQGSPDAARALLNRALRDFVAGRLKEAAIEFDNVAKLAPDSAPQLWQRGIALYYVGRYADCRAQMESYATIDPNDVENAAWHFLCAARAESPQTARAALLRIGADRRVPMPQIYRMLRGELGPDQVLAAAGSATPSLFYAHLYIGLYLDALGDKSNALKHLSEATDNRYAAVGGFMYAVARIHVQTLARRN